MSGIRWGTEEDAVLCKSIGGCINQAITAVHDVVCSMPYLRLHYRLRILQTTSIQEVTARTITYVRTEF